MIVTPHRNLVSYTLPGLAHQTVAGAAQGAAGVEVWQQTLSPGAITPPHSHPCTEVVVVLRGQGTCEIEGRVHRFAAPTTLVLPADQVHQICNTGAEDMHVIAAFGMSPVPALAPDGAVIPLPWSAS